MRFLVAPFVVALLPSSTRVHGSCPFRHLHEHHESHHDHHHEQHHHDDHVASSSMTMVLDPGGLPDPDILTAYGVAVRELDWEAVRKDLRKLFSSQTDEWPADYGHYGALFIRLAWHCTGSYRASDGRGGCDGGNQRFDPERSWADNTNLDKARSLLQPIKLKYGLGLSWGDLMVLAGTEAIRDMGGPVQGFCGGRLDTVDNTQTILLGPTPEQDEYAPCPVQGDCPSPLGTNTLGLIYVNPEGPMGRPDAVGAAATIRDVFGRMGMNDRESVALIGGGHTFGKSHGACPLGPGPPPNVDEVNPWPGNCGTGTGADTFTSGFEGPWTSSPTQWDNNYMQYLLEFEWEPHVGPGGHYQWRVAGGNGPQAPHPTNPNATQDIMMLTTDVALIKDKEYRKYVNEFANDEKAFAQAFSEIWYELITRDMGPVTRCVGDDVPPVQPFQFPLPDPPKKLADFDEVEHHLHKVMDKRDADNEFVHLAWMCAATFRVTDYRGGCNGARIRFPPATEWEAYQGLNKTLTMLEPVKEEFGGELSWADLIVLAGNVAVKRAGAPDWLPFCPGRVDATDGTGWKSLAFGNSNAPVSISDMVERFQRQGLSSKEFVALSWTMSNSSRKELSTRHLSDILSGRNGQDDSVLAVGLKTHPQLRTWAEYYVSAGDNILKDDFALAWTKMMNADRFDGPTGNLCYDGVLLANHAGVGSAASMEKEMALVVSMMNPEQVTTATTYASRQHGGFVMFLGSLVVVFATIVVAIVGVRRWTKARAWRGHYTTV